MGLTKQELLEKEEFFWKSGSQFFEEHVEEQAIFVFPGVMLDKKAGVKAANELPRWDYVAMENVKTVDLGDNNTLVTYTAIAKRGDSPKYKAGVTSIYCGDSQNFRLKFHQQTPA